MNKGKCKPTSAELSPRSFMIANSVGDEYPTWMQTKNQLQNISIPHSMH